MSFDPEATDAEILAQLLGKKIRYWIDSVDSDDIEFVRPTNNGKPFYKVERKAKPVYDQVHFVGTYGFRAIYLSNILEVRKK